jgi:hypothetical protein
VAYKRTHSNSLPTVHSNQSRQYRHTAFFSSQTLQCLRVLAADDSTIIQEGSMRRFCGGYFLSDFHWFLTCTTYRLLHVRTASTLQCMNMPASLPLLYYPPSHPCIIHSRRHGTFKRHNESIPAQVFPVLMIPEVQILYRNARGNWKWILPTCRGMILRKCHMMECPNKMIPIPRMTAYNVPKKRFDEHILTGSKAV